MSVSVFLLVYIVIAGFRANRIGAYDLIPRINSWTAGTQHPHLYIVL